MSRSAIWMHRHVICCLLYTSNVYKRQPVYRFPADIIHWGNDSQQFVGRSPYNEETLLFDIESDYAQEHPLHDEALERHCIEQMKRCMAAHDALPEQYERLGI